MSDWHSCIRCTWENDQCSKCGRPKNSPKNWRPTNPAINASAVSGPEAATIADLADPLEGVNLGEPIAAPLLAETAHAIPAAPVSEAPAVVSPPPFAAAAASRCANGSAAPARTPAMLAHSPLGGSALPRCPQCKDMHWIEAYGRDGRTMIACPSCLPRRLRERDLPAHSPLGGSAAERYMKCSASVELANMLRGERADDATQEEWTAEGTLAHSLLEHCLKRDVRDACMLIGGEGAWEAVTEQMAEAVQVALDYVRSRPGQMLVEHKFHRPELHELYYGQSDIVLYGVENDFLEVIDYKNGAGVVVDVEHNEQLMYYANGVLHSPDFLECPDDMPVRLTIMQPNAWHSGGKIRNWGTTAGYLRAWLHGDLLPRMKLTQSLDGWFFDMGEHCRFCPAKLGCPAFENLVGQALTNKPGYMTAEKVDLLKMVINAYMKDAYARLMAGANPEEVGAKLVYGKTNRTWKDGAEAVLAEKLGDMAYDKSLVSPAVAEKIAPSLVAEWAYKPDGRPTVAPLNDSRTPATPNVGSAVFSSEHVNKALASSVR